ncbi:MAG: portal protein [bacterium]
MGLFDIMGFNRFSDYFRKSRVNIEDIENQIKDNSIGLSQEEILFGNSRNSELHGTAGGMSSIPVEFEQYFYNKASRIAKYREMSNFPEISDALDNICDDAILEDDKGYMIQLSLKREVPEHIEEELRKQWKYVVYDVFNFNEFAWDLFRRWLVDGELYIELILNDDGTQIIGFKCLPPHTMTPVYDGDMITGYIQTLGYHNSNTSTYQDYSYMGVNAGDVMEIEFDKDQIVHIAYGNTGNTRLESIGFLESTIRTYNQLKNLEDASVIYRLVRAPERRIWNVQVGRMTKTKAEEYIKKLMQTYRKQITYDSSDGSMNSFENIQAMTHDYWFAKNDDEKGTTVDTLPGGCFAMDTKVSLLDGRELSIREIETEMNDGKILWTYSCHPITGKIVPGLISWAGVTQKSARVLKLTLDNNEEIICTPDHKFPVYGVGFVRADELEENSSLIPLYRKNQRLYNDKEYEQYFDNADKTWKFTHRMVCDYFVDDIVNYVIYDSDYSNGKYDVRHHIDFDKHNNNPENLQFMSWDDHRKLHQDFGFPVGVGSKAAKEKLDWMKKHDIDAYNKYCEEISIRSKDYWNNLSDVEYDSICDKIRNGILTYIDNLDENEIKKRASISRENFKKASIVFHNLMESDVEFRNHIIEKRKSYWTEEKRLNKSKESSINSLNLWNNRGDELRKIHKEKQQIEFSNNIVVNIIDLIKGKTSHDVTLKDVVDSLNSMTELVLEFKELNKDKSIPNWSIDDGFTINNIKKCIKQFGYDSWSDFRSKESIHNHRISKIEYLENEIEVGTLTIDNDERYHDYHTFALSVGVFTKNSNLGEMEDVNYFLKKLYTTLKLPSSRWKNVQAEGTGQQYSTGKSGEVTQEEIRFSRFIERLQNKFQYLVLDAYIVSLRLSGIDERYIDSSLFDIKFTKSNLFKEYKELELLTEKFTLLGSIDAYIYKPEENEQGYFDPDFVLLNWFNMSKDEYDLNKKLLEARKAATKEKQDLETFDNDEGEGEEGDDFGVDDAEDVDFGADEVEEPTPAEESVSFKLLDGKKTSLFNEFVSFDNTIKNKYRNKE